MIFDHNTSSLSLSALRNKIAAEKKPSTAKGYLAAIARLEDLAGCDTISAAAITPALIADYSRLLLGNGVTPATASLYRRNLRAAIRKNIPAEWLPQIDIAFADTDSHNETDTHLPSLDDFATLRDATISHSPLLEATRSIFLLSTFLGGASIDTIRCSQADAPAMAIPQVRYILDKFNTATDSHLPERIEHTTNPGYTAALNTLSEFLHLKSPLTPESAAYIWLQQAIKCGIDPTIALAVPCRLPEAVVRQFGGNSDFQLSEEQRVALLQQVADRLYPLGAHWYALRCVKGETTIPLAYLRDSGITDHDIFHPFEPSPQQKHDRLLGSLIFFRTSPGNASRIRRCVPDGSYIFTFADSSHTPAWIPDRAMRTFMFLCNAAPDTIISTFPSPQQEEQHLPGDTVEITDGSFAGLKGRILSQTRDLLKVTLTIETLNNLSITATLPTRLIKKN